MTRNAQNESTLKGLNGNLIGTSAPQLLFASPDDAFLMMLKESLRSEKTRNGTQKLCKVVDKFTFNGQKEMSIVPIVC